MTSTIHHAFLAAPSAALALASRATRACGQQRSSHDMTVRCRRPALESSLDQVSCRLDNIPWSCKESKWTYVGVLSHVGLTKACKHYLNYLRALPAAASTAYCYRVSRA